MALFGRGERSRQDGPAPVEGVDTVLADLDGVV